MNERRAIIIDTPPTSNGDLHVGHLAGPFMAADVHARYLRADGRPVVFSSGTDDSQTYVLASARRKGLTPEELSGRSWHEIRSTLAGMGVSLDGFAPYDDRYRASVLSFLTALHRAGRFREKTVMLPYSERRGEYLVEGLVCGYCPICLVESRGGLCETCGHPNNFDELIRPRSTVDPDDVVTHREARILVLPMEEYRDRLTAYYREREPRLRPHTTQLVREVLARPLPDFPITYPVGWGIPAPFPETPGQRINAWAEGMPAVMYTTAYAAERLGERHAADDELWRAEHDPQIVYFIGFDNVYFWGFTHIALLMAHEGRYALPDTFVSNEFYELENAKFSTSLGHVLYTKDLLKEVPRDLVRFYLAISAPEHQLANFGREALARVCGDRLVRPWNRLAGLLGKAVADAGAEGADLPVSDEGRRRAEAVLARFRACYELSGYSLTRAANLIVGQLDRLVAEARLVHEGHQDAAGDPARLGDLFLDVRVLVACASPILIDLARAAGEAGGFTCRLDAEEFRPARVTPFALPLLATPGDTPAARRATLDPQ
ncbi:class I tRNA ligase family protein [Microbispora sp. ATCC PTA-5024]|uniref:class I tRNA ligase family protein n=1 Tax=Microbispora sp. ATCC PTA-5024 TaxID=316330 RepID=UPI0003DBC3ED|nr:class I tRNA ligase family protein [Microbispora sp. ATCC PTA-5024]ETK33440.1 methionyl-tRNA synthetase [Microbispora sp. ATCC PTA-5024]